MKFKRSVVKTLIALGLTLVTSSALVASSNPPAYKVFGQVTNLETLVKEEQDRFHRLEKEKYQLIDAMAKDAYLQAYWQKVGKEKGISAEQARERYMNEHVKVSDAEFKETLEKYKDHPKLKDLPKKEQEEQIRNFLRAQGESQVTQALIDEGLKSNNLQVMYPRPTEPVYKMEVTQADVVRFGPGLEDTKPKANGCKGNDCPITVVEYSEFQCPFCARVIPTTQRLLEKYEGKIRWVLRDFPLNFHPRARPAAIAAKCAGFQGRYLDMYHMLFDNQQNLGDSDIESYAKKIEEKYKDKPAAEKFDKAKFDQCLAKSDEAEKLIDQHMQTAQAAGVTGTPAFFINGRRLSGALPFDEFQTVIEEELSKKAH